MITFNCKLCGKSITVADHVLRAQCLLCATVNDVPRAHPAIGEKKQHIGKQNKYNCIAAGSWHTVGVRSDGTAIAVGYNQFGQCDVEKFTDCISVACGYNYTVVLRSDGSVAAVGGNENGQCNVEGWQGIIFVTCGRDHTDGIKADGTV
ncbi:MAG: hypothetical protein IKM24_02050, partial [Clostridia bacterium]|nr:hypothetical protein [Clostridia bacterium]